MKSKIQKQSRVVWIIEQRHWPEWWDPTRQEEWVCVGFKGTKREAVDYCRTQWGHWRVSKFIRAE